MPVGKPATRREVTAVALALGGVLVAVALGVVMLVVARDGDVEVRLGSDTWEVGRADVYAAAIAEDGPFLVQDLSGGDRDVYVAHVGSEPESGWYAYAARTSGSDRACSVVWDPAEGELRDPCTQATFPPEGAGLEQYPVYVDDGRVVVDINRTRQRAPAEDSPPRQVVESGIPARQG